MIKKMKLFWLLSTLILVSNGSRLKRQAIIFGQPPPSTSDNFDCTTPDNQRGSCIVLKDCTALFSQFRTNPNGQFLDFLRQSICRYENSRPVVCCANMERPANLQSPTPSSFTIPTPPSPTPSPTPFPTPPPPPPPPPEPPVEPPTQPPEPETVPPVVPVLRGFDLLPSLCGNSTKPTSRIVGGRIAEQGAWPWLAALGYRARGRIVFLCGGALITSKHILTAAHCVHRRNDLQIIRMGEHNLDLENETQHEDYNITKRITHANYDSTTFVNDIAILTVDRPVEFKKHIRPVCLPMHDFFKDNPLAGFQAFVAGWGSIAFNNVSSPILKEAMLPVRTNEDCKNGYAVFRSVVINKDRLCAGDGGSDACQGDSGGPLMISNPMNKLYYVTGVVSVGFRCAEAEFPGIYTRVNQYLDWIEQNLD